MRCGSKVLAVAWFSFIFSLSANIANADELVLNGSASYFHLTRDYYIGGLYLPLKSDNIDYIHSSSIAKRMKIVIQVPSWTPRRWSQIWQNNIAINNENLSPTPQMQQALMEFTSFPRTELKAGDEVIIDYQPNGNSRVLLNNDTVIEVPGTDFFNYMVNTWVGSLPPTREFRQLILGQENASDKHAGFLASHQPARLDLWSGWIAAEQAQQEALEQARLAEARRQAQEAAEAKRQAEEAARRTEELRKQEEKARIAAAAAAQKAVQATAPVAKAAKKQAPTTSAANNNTNALKVLADEQTYYLKMLQWELQRKVEANVSYPAWAKQFGQEGNVIIDFRLFRNNDIGDIQVRDPSISEILTNEVRSALRKAVENQTISKELAGDSWLLKAQYHFKLQNSKQPEFEMPIAPASLQKASKADPKKLEEQYITAQTEKIIAAVVYPPGAKILKKQDLVRISVQVDKTGKVLAIKEEQSSRHRELNQALTDAVKNSAPFPAFPLGLQQESLEFQVEYNFKL